MQDLGTLGGAFTFSVAGSINNRGQVVGANFMSSGQSRAFVWQDGVMTALDDSDGSSSALGINARGDIAGQILPAGGGAVGQVSCGVDFRNGLDRDVANR